MSVKTGTTQNNVDGWTIGFTPKITVGVWAGNNNRVPMQKISEAMAGPIWRAFLLKALPKVGEPMINLPPAETSTSTPAAATSTANTEATTTFIGGQ